MALDGTYSGLQASIADFLNRQDLAAAIPDFIAMAEAQMTRYLVRNGAPPQMMGRSDATVTGEFVSVPTDFYGVKAFYMTNTYGTDSLVYAEPDQINGLKATFNPGVFNSFVSPTTFSVVGTEFQFFPWTSGWSFPAELTYWKKIPALSNANTTNWMLTANPDAYLYGSLLQSAPYLKDDDRIEVWETAFAQILGDIVESGKIAKTSTNIAIPYVPSGTP